MIQRCRDPLWAIDDLSRCFQRKWVHPYPYHLFPSFASNIALVAVTYQCEWILVTCR
jgi:hypothetical protein